MEVKGRVFQQIEDLNRAARSAFYKQLEIGGKFNKDILLRARKTRAKAVATDAAATAAVAATDTATVTP
jgi:hypothetical protein